MKRSAIIIGAVLLFCIMVAVAFAVFRTKDLSYAIGCFDDGDYQEAIEVLNRLIPLADYETGEKLHYYRARSLARLASELDDDYSSELAAIALEKKGAKDFERTRGKIEKKLERINSRTGADLAVFILPRKSRIASRGIFYQDFISRYRGSYLIQDLEFEDIARMEKTSPEKVPDQAIAFFIRYPGTPYIAQLVRMVMDSLEKGSADMTRNGDTFIAMLATYGRRYPSADDVARLFRTKGDKVNLRATAGVSGQPVGKISAGETVIQLEKSMDTAQVGDTRDYWYRIATLKGVQGWIFGKFLEPVDLASLSAGIPAGESWNMDENFSAWTDSHTPRNWVHIQGALRDSISFTGSGDGTVAVVSSQKGQSAGLYSRYQVMSAFELTVRVRLRSGDGFTPVVISLGGTGYYLHLASGQLDMTGRVIPATTSDWHEYTLKSTDGRFCTLYIDGELIAGRIAPVRLADYPMRGIYALLSGTAETSEGEMKYLRVR